MKRLLLLLCSTLIAITSFGQTIKSSFYSTLKSGDSISVLKAVDNNLDVNIYNSIDLMTPLMVAAKYNKDEKVINVLLDAGADINATDYYNWTALIYSINFNNDNVTMALINGGADVNKKNSKNNTALTLAISLNKSLNIVKALINAGANLNVKDENGNTPLLLALENNASYNFIRLLIRGGARANVKNINNKTSLMIAASKTHNKFVIEILLDSMRGSTVYEINDNQDALMYAAQYNTDKAVIQVLLDYGFNINKRNSIGASPLNYAIDYNTKEIVKFLKTKGAIRYLSDISYERIAAAIENSSSETLLSYIEEGVSLDVNLSGTPILHYAAEQNSKKAIIDILVESGLNPNKLYLNRAPLANAIDNIQYYKSISVETAVALINNGADINLATGNQTTLTYLALFSNPNDELAKLLLKEGASVDMKNKQGYTPLQQLIISLENLDKHSNSEDSYNYAEILINNGADVNVRDENHYNYTCFMYGAKFAGNSKILKLLVDNGANISATDDYNYSSLMIATINNDNSDILEYLLDSSKNIDATTNNGVTTAMYAARYIENEKLLKKYIDKGMNFSIINSDGWSALDYALAYNPNDDIVDSLIKKSRTVINHPRGSSGETPLILASKYERSLFILKRLIATGANINNQSSTGATSLIYSINDYDKVKYLVSKKADLDIQDSNGRTAIMHGLRGNVDLDIISFMVDKNANLSLTDIWGDDAYSYGVKFSELYKVNYTEVLTKENKK